MTEDNSDSALLIFSRAPVTGQVKTRLQPALTPEQATEAHIELTRLTLARAFEPPLCPVILYCTPDDGHPFFRQCAREYPLTLAVQRGRDLGERMHLALSDALSRYRRVLLMGCDCPSLQAGDLRQALAALKQGYDAVMAPAEDGGYVLIGLNKPCPGLFTGIRWGSEQVMVSTRQRARRLGLRWYELATQWDVDRIDDWIRYREKTPDDRAFRLMR